METEEEKALRLQQEQETPGLQEQGDGSQESGSAEPVEFQIPEGAPTHDGDGRKIYYDEQSPGGYIIEAEAPEIDVAPAPSPAPTPVYTAPKPASQYQQQTIPTPAAPVQIVPAPPYYDAEVYIDQNRTRLDELSLMDRVAYDRETYNARKQSDRSAAAIKSHQMQQLRDHVPELYNLHHEAMSESLDILPPAQMREPDAIVWGIYRAAALEAKKLMAKGVPLREATLQVAEQTSTAIRGKQQPPAPKPQPQTRVNPAAPRGTPSGTVSGGSGTSAPVGTRSNPKPVGIPGYPMGDASEVKKVAGQFKLRR